MDEDELRSVLGAANRPMDPPQALTDRIKADMAASLDDSEAISRSASPGHVPVISLSDRSSSGGRRRRWPLLTSVAASAIVLVGAVVITADEGDPNSIAASSPPSYLSSCIDFQNATSRDGVAWFDLLSELDVDDPGSADYLVELADALDALALSSLTSPARDRLTEASALARSSGSADQLAAIELELDDAWRVLAVNTGLPCLDTRPVTDEVLERGN